MDSKLKRTWEKDEYYELAKKGSLDVRHPAMKLLKKLARPNIKILDLGCGEGTRLNYICRNPENCVGIDISSKAIQLAGKNYPNFSFLNANLEKLPQKNEAFDLVYSAFVLEHLEKPEKVIKEAIRVLKKGGHLVMVAPNFGSPNRASPPFRGSRSSKLLFGFFADFVRPFSIQKKLGWKNVEPIATESNYKMDWDTTIEPYLGSLIYYLKHLGMKVIFFSSCWEEEVRDVKIQQKLFRFLGEAGVFPFYYWGPHLLLSAIK